MEENIGNFPYPALNRKQLLNPLFCKSIISIHLFDNWCDTLCTSTILKFEYRSYCPNQRCSPWLSMNAKEKLSVKRVDNSVGMMFCLENWWKEKDGVDAIIVVNVLSILEYVD
ncbi:hypothetical protein TanjilG_09651 [Lupinus angustifolius]|uniref:Uncharacterized protein n=1 Tax=Lupinus angustifolius TaxID=3871 RepID=A0A4P1R3M3_LUPAN|nr:hypothetical protein TanjilG_09651 [Lupinus angustifolius]